MTTHIARGIGILIDGATYPHTLMQEIREVKTGVIHLSVREMVWVWVYLNVFPCRARWLRPFLLEAFA